MSMFKWAPQNNVNWGNCGTADENWAGIAPAHQTHYRWSNRRPCWDPPSLRSQPVLHCEAALHNWISTQFNMYTRFRPTITWKIWKWLYTYWRSRYNHVMYVAAPASVVTSDALLPTVMHPAVVPIFRTVRVVALHRRVVCVNIWWFLYSKWWTLYSKWWICI